MLARRLYYGLTGGLEIRVSGPFVEKFLNLANRNGIYLWDVRVQAGQMRAKIGAGDFRQLRPLARRTRSHVRIVRRFGLPFRLVRLRRRAVWVAAGCASLALILVLSQFIWFVRVEGCDVVTPAEVAAAAAKAGLRPGVTRRSLDLPAVRQRILLELDRLSWVAINVRGALVTLEVVEKTAPPADQTAPTGPCDLTAARDAVVDEIIVLAGEARVKVGDTVRAGDVLIAGIMGENLVTEYPHVVPVPVRARGLVRGRVWREGRADVPLTQVEYVRTGRTCQSLVMKVGKWEIVLWGKAIPFADYIAQPAAERRGLWRSLHSPVEFIRTTYHEVERVETQLTPAEARMRAERLATNLALRDVPDGAVVVRREAFVEAEDQAHVVVRAVVETREDIAGPLVPRQ